MIRRLDWVAFTPGTVLDLGCGTGHGAAALAARWPRARVIALDVSAAMLEQAARRDGAARIERLCAEAEAIPLPDASVDLVHSNLMLPWCEDIDAVFGEVARILSPRGLFTFTSYGPGTLQELRGAWHKACGTTPEHPVAGTHDLGDGLVRGGFAEPVLDVSRYTLTYADVASLMRDLKATGSQGATSGRARGLTGRGRRRALESSYEQFRTDGRLPASFEVVFGQAWGAMPADRRDGEFAIPVGSISRRGPGRGG